jgi:hypothetical protein
LLRRYQAWNQFLPELFLWHTFVALARVAIMMEEGGNPWKVLTGEGEKPAPPSSFLLHRDFKPANISLGDSTGQADGSGEFTATYPKLKVGDFGIAELTDPTAARNPKDLFGRGTRFFKPPEQTLTGVEWDALMRHEYHDLRWGPLRPPYERWKTHIDRAAAKARADGTWPVGQGPFRWVDGGIVFTPDIPAAPVPPVASAQPIGPAPPPPEPAPGRRACTHRCRDKTTCGHAVCCKIGLK